MNLRKKLKEQKKNLFLYTKNILQNSIASNMFIPHRLRNTIYRLYNHKIQGTVFPKCFLGAGKGKLIIGTNSFINYSCFLDLSNDIIIGNNVSIGFKTTFINAFHNIGNSSARAGQGKDLPILIEDGCWIGANVTIMPGVRIGKGCIIGAGSLVTKSTEPDCIYIGAPAKKLRELKSQQ